MACPSNCQCECHVKTVIIGGVAPYSRGHSPEANRHYDAASKRIKHHKAMIERRNRRKKNGD